MYLTLICFYLSTYSSCEKSAPPLKSVLVGIDILCWNFSALAEILHQCLTSPLFLLKTRPVLIIFGYKQCSWMMLPFYYSVCNRYFVTQLHILPLIPSCII